MFDINTFNIRFQIGSIHHYFGRRLNFKISSQPCCLFQRRTSNGTDCIHYFMSHILKKQGKQISPCLYVHVHGCTHTHTCGKLQRWSYLTLSFWSWGHWHRVLAAVLNSECLTWRSLWSFLFSRLGFFIINSFRTLKGPKRKKNKTGNIRIKEMIQSDFSQWPRGLVALNSIYVFNESMSILGLCWKE